MVIDLTSWKGLLTGSVLFAFFLLAPPLVAQETRTLQIREGVVLMDGRELENHTLPTSLDLEGLEVHYVFSGNAQPILELGDHVYRLEATRLIDITSEMPAPRAPRLRLILHDSTAGQAFHGPYSTLAPGLHQASVSPRTSTALFSAAGHAANEASLSADETSLRDVRMYLETLREHGGTLYEQLSLEWAMEAHARRLAINIAQLAEGPQRQQAYEELRAILEELFVLKQDNHRAELEQLEVRLKAMREQLDAREAARDAIIGQRLRELVDHAQTVRREP